MRREREKECNVGILIFFHNGVNVGVLVTLMRNGGPHLVCLLFSHVTRERKGKIVAIVFISLMV
jgi:hypothetical protein